VSSPVPLLLVNLLIKQFFSGMTAWRRPEIVVAQCVLAARLVPLLLVSLHMTVKSIQILRADCTVDISASQVLAILGATPE
jgi:hypothetical protein